MPTNCAGPLAVFLFAHQDDEFGVYQRLADCSRLGKRIVCAYLTDGAAGGVSAATRNAESSAVLAQLGVAAGDILFAGERLGIADAALPLRLAQAEAWLEHWLGTLGQIDEMYVPAWEGGHHDHDALHALGVVIASRNRWLSRVRQYPLYNAARMLPPFFRTLAPLPENGPVQVDVISLGMRLRCLRWCLSYPSQRRTWLGLFPFALWKYLLVGKQNLQQVSMERLEQRPHAGPLYYEQRRFFTWPRMQQQLQAWRATGAAIGQHDT